MLDHFLFDESGATAIEYGIIAAGIAVAIMVAVGTVGSTLSGKFDDISASIDNIQGTAP